MQTLTIHNQEIPYTTETASINVTDIITKFVPWKDWCDSLDSNIKLKHIHFQHVDVIHDRIIFLKMKCTCYVGEESKPIPGIVFLRGSAVSCLIEIVSEGKTYALLIEQPRLASGKSNLREVVAGMMDGERNFTGGMVREIKVSIKLFSLLHYYLNTHFFIHLLLNIQRKKLVSK